MPPLLNQLEVIDYKINDPEPKPLVQGVGFTSTLGALAGDAQFAWGGQKYSYLVTATGVPAIGDNILVIPVQSPWIPGVTYNISIIASDAQSVTLCIGGRTIGTIPGNGALTRTSYSVVPQAGEQLAALTFKAGAIPSQSLKVAEIVITPVSP